MVGPLAAAAIGAALPTIIPAAIRGSATAVRELKDQKKKSPTAALQKGAGAALDRLAVSDVDDHTKGGQIVHLNPILNIKIKKLSKPATEQFERDKAGKIVETAGILPIIGGALMGPVGGVLGGVAENPDAPAGAIAGGAIGGIGGEAIGKAVTPMATGAAQGAGEAISGAGGAVQEGLGGVEKMVGGMTAPTPPLSSATAQPPLQPTAPLSQSIGGGIKGAGEYVSKWGSKAAGAVTTPLATGMGASMGSTALSSEQRKKGATSGIPLIQDMGGECDQNILDRFLAKK